MMLRMWGSLFLGLAVLVAGTEAGGVKGVKEKKAAEKEKKVEPVKEKASKDKDAKTELKDPAKDPRAVTGKILSVDFKDNEFTIGVEGAKGKAAERTFGVNKDTEFLGPRGGKGEGLKDDRLAKGYEVIVIPSKDGKTAEEVHLSYRKTEEKKKEKTPVKEKK